jgi:hypothetical protein
MFLTDGQFEDIKRHVKLVEFDENYRINDFDSGIEDYNEFLVNTAKICIENNISNVYLLINKANADIIGYMTLSNDSIKLSDDEKEIHGIDEIPFRSFPALKIGQLAIDKRYKKITKGYGSFLIELSIAFAANLSEYGTICRFITVDADTTSDTEEKSVVDFYIKNGFKLNEEYNKDKRKKNKSMRLDIFSE